MIHYHDTSFCNNVSFWFSFLGVSPLLISWCLCLVYIFFLKIIHRDALMLLLRMKSSWQIRILRSLFPPWLLKLYKKLISPLGGGEVAALMVGEYFDLFFVV